MSKRTLRTVTRAQGNNRALKAGEITLPDFALDFEEVNPLPRAFRNMVREQAYDVSEMALTTYITARAYGVPITAIPVFLVRDFHHKSIVKSLKATITQPKDLEGRRVGVSRGYTVTTGVWARAILAEEYGVDLSQITWARSDDEHVLNWRIPAHVEDLGGEGSLDDQLARADIDAAVGLVESNATRSLITDHLLKEVPDIAVQVFEAFSASKRAYLTDLKAGRITAPTAADNTYLAALEVMDDPLPYGLAPNADTLNKLVDHVVAQGIIDAVIPLEDLFAPGSHELVG